MAIEKENEINIKEQIGNHFVKSMEEIDFRLLLHLVPENILRDLSFFNFKNAITACFYTDRNLIVKNFNQNFKSFFKNVDEPIIGADLRGLFGKLGIENDIIENFWEQLSNQGRAIIPEFNINLKSEVRYFSLFSTFTDFENISSLSGIQGQFIDITQEVHLRKQQDRLASQIRHDMKNRISASLMGSEMVLQDYHALQEGNKLPVELTDFFQTMEETLKDINESSDYLSRLVLQMLDVSKLQDSQLSLDITRFQTNDALDQVIKALRPLQENRNIEVEIVGDSVEIEADFVQLSRVLENYHSNALKYSNKKVTWNILAEERRRQGELEKGHLIIMVQDDGEGISAEFIENIFLPFFQVPGKEKKGSTGLGLDSARELINLHHGTTWAESDGPGTGSRFFIKLPLTQPERS